MLNVGLIKALKANTKYKIISAVVILSALVLLYTLAGRGYFPGQTDDDARHVLSAKSLLQFHYNDISSPDFKPITNQLPGYPVLLVLPMLTGNVLYGQVLSVIFTIASAVLLFLILRRNSLIKKYAVFITCLFAFHPTTVTMAFTVMSEPAYIFWSLLIFYLLGNTRIKPLWFIFIIFFIAWIRPQGFLLLAAVSAYYLPRLKRGNRIFYPLLAASLILLPYIRNFLVSSTPASYFSEIPAGRNFFGYLMSLAVNIKSNAVYYFFNTALLPFGVNIRSFGRVLMWAVFALIFWIVFLRGAVETLKSEESELSKVRLGYILLMLAAHLFWVNQSARYVYVLVPFIYEVIFTGITKSLPKKYSKIVLTGIFCFIMVFFGILNFNVLKRSLNADFKNSALFGASVWIKQNTAKSDIFMAQYRDTLYYLTERKTYGYYFDLNADNWYEKLIDLKVNYIVVNESFVSIKRTPIRQAGFKILRAFIGFHTQDTNWFKPVHTSKDKKIRIYEITTPVGFKDANNKFKKIVSSITNENLDETLSKLLKLKKQNVSLKRLDFALGTTYMLKKDYKKARLYLEKAVELEPYFKRARLNLDLVNRYIP